MRRIRLYSAAVCVFGWYIVGTAATYNYTILNVQLPGVRETLSTCVAKDVNDLGVIVGECSTATRAIGWTYDGRKYSPVRVDEFSTSAEAVNNARHVAGLYWDNARAWQVSSFLRRNGGVETISVAGAKVTEGFGINDYDDLVGDYVEADGMTWHGWARIGSAVTVIDVPGAVNTQAADINNYGVVVGCYTHCRRGFVYDSVRRTYEAIDVPGAVMTTVAGVNDLNELVGAYSLDGVSVHGFKLDEGGYSAIDVPGATGTVPMAINRNGAVVGYAYANGSVVAFVAR